MIARFSSWVRRSHIEDLAGHTMNCLGVGSDLVVKMSSSSSIGVVLWRSQHKNAKLLCATSANAVNP